MTSSKTSFGSVLIGHVPINSLIALIMGATSLANHFCCRAGGVDKLVAEPMKFGGLRGVGCGWD